MTSRLTECSVDCADPARLSRFWAEALGYRIVEDSAGLVEIGPGEGTDEQRLATLRSGPALPSIVFARVPEPKSGKNRLHFDLSPIDGDQDGEVSRLEALGAQVTDLAPADSGWVVMTDPEGNEFCVCAASPPVTSRSDSSGGCTPTRPSASTYIQPPEASLPMSLPKGSATSPPLGGRHPQP